MSVSNSSLFDLPLEIISRINTFLSIRTFLAFTATCRSYHTLDCYDGRRYAHLEEDFNWLFQFKNNSRVDDILANILKRGFRTNERNFADYGHIKTFKIMCEIGLTRDFLGRELLVAAGHGRLDFCILLYSYGADLNYTDGMINLITPLVFAAPMDYDVCEFLLMNGADVEAPGSEMTPLIAACAKNYGDICKLLILNHANVNEARENITPLIVAVENGSLECCKVLVEAGANMEHEIEGATALFYAYISSKLHVFTYLLDSGADFSRLYTGYSLLHLSASNHNYKVYQDLLNRGIDSSLKSPMGDTAFDIVRKNTGLEGEERQVINTLVGVEEYEQERVSPGLDLNEI